MKKKQQRASLWKARLGEISFFGSAAGIALCEEETFRRRFFDSGLGHDAGKNSVVNAADTSTDGSVG